MDLTDRHIALDRHRPDQQRGHVRAGYTELGHMELFAEVYHATNQATMLVSGNLRCVHLHALLAA